MGLFWEFFSFEIKLRLKSLSTYVYFTLWFLISFLSIAAEDFINTGNDKILLNGPFATSILYFMLSFFGMLIIAAVFGLSERYLPNHFHQTDHQVRLPRRPLGRLLRHHRPMLQRHGFWRGPGHACSLG
jgi:hypothetical protein